eukprot:gb/GECH01002677.1/.p1 GENE.gb/GECH01002677.1/~~gb/GECH01002677.1/.p1  ORF type:complete len:112 (+),score=15.31 gb/GECH01002677.1/:1-336(+)
MTDEGEDDGIRDGQGTVVEGYGVVDGERHVIGRWDRHGGAGKGYARGGDNGIRNVGLQDGFKLGPRRNGVMGIVRGAGDHAMGETQIGGGHGFNKRCVEYTRTTNKNQETT